MLPGQPSRTLLRSAIRRAQHQLLDHPRIIEDPVAVRFVSDVPELSQSDGTSEPTLYRYLFAMRARFAEDRLAAAVSRGCRCYVMIGSGLETYPWRQPEQARNIQIIAADHPDSLVWTQDWLRERSILLPSNMIQVPVDLENESLEDRLASIGFNENNATFFSALGVLPYLGAGAIERLLRFVSSLRAGSEIVFTFNPPETDLAGPDLRAAIHAVGRTGALGEPWRYRPIPRELIDSLQGNGFSDVFHLTPTMAHERYLSIREDKLRAPGWEQMIAATV
jgi:methyltransferase (TIGR00027 family)